MVTSYLGTSSNTVAPATLAKFISGGKPVALGSTCQNPTGSTPVVCSIGNGTAMATNQGTASNAFTTNAVYTGGALFAAPYGPAGAPAHQATLKWLPQWPAAEGSGTSMTTSVNGMPIATGDFLVIAFEVGSSSSTNHAPACPTGGATTWTTVGPSFDAGEAFAAVLCYGFAGSGETGADTLTWTTSTDLRTARWVYLDYGQTVASVDTGATGCYVTYNGTHTLCSQGGSHSGNTSTIYTASLTTSSANETVVSIFTHWNAAGGGVNAAPSAGVERFHVQDTGSPAQIEVSDLYAIPTSSNTQQSMALTADGGSTGFSLALVPN
jgi:hypothetical protein